MRLRTTSLTRATPSPLCGGGWPAKRVGRGETGFRKGRGLHAAQSFVLHRRSPLPTPADAGAPRPRKGGRGSHGADRIHTVDREAA
jgi:peptide/nickel transport system substrate-binding protein